MIFRESVANIIAHRDYMSASPATMMIYADRVEFSNPNIPHYFGRIDPNRFKPFPKNPVICKFMLQMGRYEELGSGFRRVNKYLPYYAPGAGKAIFEDGNEMFTVTVPLGMSAPPVTPPVTPPVETLLRLLGQAGEFGNDEIRRELKLKDRTHLRERFIDPALTAGLIEMTIPDKPNSRLQKYRLTNKGRMLIRRN